MVDFREQLRAYYEARSLAPQKVAAIFAHCRGEAVRDEEGERKIIAFPSLWRRPSALLALAAVLVCFAGAIWLWTQQTVPYPALQARVAEFFGGKYDIPVVSQDQAALREWLIAHGAPASFEVPEKVRPMQAYGCRVLDVQHEEAFLMCFWLPTAPDEKRALLHLLAARRSDFRGEPSSAKVEFTRRGDWSFAAWSEGEVIYTLGSMVPPERLYPYVAALRAQQQLLAKSRSGL